MKNLAFPSFRRTVQLVCGTLLGVYVLLSAALLGWLWWMPENDSLALSHPTLFVVLVDGQEGLSSSGFCAYDIAWESRDWLGFTVSVPDLREGHFHSCEIIRRVGLWDGYLDIGELPVDEL